MDRSMARKASKKLISEMRKIAADARSEADGVDNLAQMLENHLLDEDNDPRDICTVETLLRAQEEIEELLNVHTGSSRMIPVRSFRRRMANMLAGSESAAW